MQFVSDMLAREPFIQLPLVLLMRQSWENGASCQHASHCIAARKVAIVAATCALRLCAFGCRDLSRDAGRQDVQFA